MVTRIHISTNAEKAGTCEIHGSWTLEEIQAYEKGCRAGFNLNASKTEGESGPLISSTIEIWSD